MDDQERASKEPIAGAKGGWTLVVTALLLNGVAYWYNIEVTGYIRRQSGSISTDLALRLAYFALMVAVTASEVLLVDHFAFGGGWRRKVLSGMRGRMEGEVGDAPSLGRSLFRDYTAHVAVAFLVLLGLNYVLFNASNGWFDSYYRKVGHFYTELRSSNERDRIRAIDELAPIRHAGVSAKLLERLIKGTVKEKTWSAWALGYRAAYDLIEDDLKEKAQDAALALIRSDAPDHDRAVVAMALARMNSFEWMESGLKGLASASPDPQFAIAFGWLEDHRSKVLEALGRLLDRGKGVRAEAAAWALGQMRDSVAASILRKRLRTIDPEALCIAVESLGRLSDVAAVPLLVKLFEAKKSDRECKQVVVRLKPNGSGDRFYLYAQAGKAYKSLGCVRRHEPLRVRILKVLARIGDKSVLPWVRRMATNQGVGRSVRDCAVRVYNAAVE
ncbi:MAG: hypothetical protein J7M25_10855 [Deltaproteobacteria bacterium]|nr:hypothetical protein [Deltaproteobacteria bacterium]